jgi:hypothetical protein
VGEVTRGEPLRVPRITRRRLASAFMERATAPRATDGAGIAPNLPKTPLRIRGRAGGHSVRGPMGARDGVDCTTNFSLHAAEMQRAGNGMAPSTAPYMEHSFWTALTVVAAKVVRPVHSGLPDGLISFANTSPPLPDIWPDLQHKAGSAALGQIIRCMLIQVKPRVRLSRPPIPKNIPPIMHGAWESGFPPDVIQTNGTRLGRRGFTPVLLCSNTPLQSESRKEPFCSPS